MSGRALREAYLAVRAGMLMPFARRAKFEPESVKRILVIRNDRIGDMVLTTPLVRALGQGLPGATLDVLASRANREVLASNPFVHEVIVAAGGQLKTAFFLRERRYDLVVDAVPTYRLDTALTAYLSGASCRVGFAWGGREALFNLPCPSLREARHAVLHGLELARALGIGCEGCAPELFLSAQEKAAGLSALKDAGASQGKGAPIAALAPGAHYPTQRWPAARYGALADALSGRYGARVAVFTARGEEALRDEVRGSARLGHAYVHGLPLRVFMAALSHCAVFVGNNSGPLHIAAALGLPTVSFQGPTDPAMYAPYGGGHVVLSAGLDCLYCGRGRCGELLCMEGISVDDAAEAAGRMVKYR